MPWYIALLMAFVAFVGGVAYGSDKPRRAP